MEIIFIFGNFRGVQCFFSRRFGGSRKTGVPSNS